jgi:predicted anti-sigma-YlaC factor YlaD
MFRKRTWFLGVLCILPFLISCSINKMAINAVSNLLTGTGSSDVFTTDNDPELVGEALPFAIKLYETLLSRNPDHQGLILTTGSLFVMYANAFVQGPAELLDPVDYYYERTAANERAKKLYLRGNALLNTALEKKFPGFSGAAAEDGSLQNFLNKCKKEDVPLLYWTAAGGIAAYSLDVFDFELGYQIPEWDAMIARAYELDPDFNNGAIDELYIMFYAALPENLGGDKDKAEIHFRRALEKSNYLSAGPYVSYAKSICIPAQDYDAFEDNLQKALAIDPDADPSSRLLNVISQRKARYLLDTAYEYFTFP